MKGEVSTRLAESMYKEQIEKIYEKSSTDTTPSLNGANGSKNIPKKQEDMVSLIKEIIGTVLGISNTQLIDSTATFESLGVRSFEAIRICTALTEALAGIILTANQLYEYGSVYLLSQYLLSPTTHQEVSNKTTHAQDTAQCKDRPSTFELTIGQKGLYWIWNTNPSSTVYNTVYYVKYNEVDVDLALLEQCWRAITKRHCMMQVKIAENVELGQPSFIADYEMVNPFSVTHVSDGNSVLQAMTATYQVTFNLLTGPLFRLHLFSCKTSHILMVLAHHIVTDFFAMVVIWEELMHLYGANKQKLDIVLPCVAFHIDYVDHEQQRLKSKGADLLKFWTNKLPGGIPRLNLNFAKQSQTTTQMVSSYAYKFDSNTRAQLEAAAKHLGVTPFQFLFAGFQILLAMCTNQTGIVVGAFYSSRGDLPHLQRLVSYMVDLVLIHSEISMDLTVSEMIAKISKNIKQAFQHVLPYPMIKEALDKLYGRSNLQASINCIAFDENALDKKCEYFPNIVPCTDMLELEGLVTDLDLELNAVSLNLNIKFNSLVFDSKDIATLISQYKELLVYMSSHQSTPLAQINLVTDVEYDTIINSWNDTAIPWPYTSVYELVEKQYQENPNGEALVYANERITYSELQQRVNTFADILSKFGAGPNIVVGVCCHKSIALFVAILAVFKLRAAYLPLEPNLPLHRRNIMLASANAKILISERALLEALRAGAQQEEKWKDRVICIDMPLSDVQILPLNESLAAPTQNDIAYIIFSSGSTGTPKGILVSQQNILNTICWFCNTYKLKHSDKRISVYSISFDGSIGDIFWMLGCGSTLVIAKQGDQLDSEYILDTIYQEKVTVFDGTPSYLQTLSQHPKFEQCATSIHTFAIGGEQVPLALYKKFGGRLHNMYGPSETTICSTYFHCGPDLLTDKVYSGIKAIPVGRPIANTKIYILDQNMKPVPCGVRGEIYIGGASVGLGYLNNPDLTAQKFLPDPFDSAARVFKTGDFARFLSNGEIEFYGRQDDYVKLRGFRVELGEIEACLQHNLHVKEAVVVVKNSESQMLVAYIRLHEFVEDYVPLVKSMRQHLFDILPYYMVPAQIVVLKEFPLNVNGKTDRVLLQKMEHDLREHQPVQQPPKTKQEAMLRTLWEQLNVHALDESQTFYEAGGSSLLAMQFLYKFQAAFNIPLPISKFLNSPTIGGVLQFLEQSGWQESHVACNPLLTPSHQNGSKQNTDHEIAPKLVLLNQGTNPYPIFLVHPLAGTVEALRPVAHHLGKENYTVYGFIAHGLNVGETPREDIKEIAASFLEGLKKTQSVGPYHIGGYSFGGIVAYEMATQLLSNNEEVAWLGLLDSAPTEPAVKLSTIFELVLQRDDSSFSFPSRLEDAGTIELLEYAHKRHAKLAALDWPIVLQFGSVWEANEKAMLKYTPQPYPRKMYLYQSEESESKRMSCGWESLVSELVGSTVPGGHFTFIFEPYVVSLAHAIASHLSCL